MHDCRKFAVQTGGLLLMQARTLPWGEPPLLASSRERTARWLQLAALHPKPLVGAIFHASSMGGQ